MRPRHATKFKHYFDSLCLGHTQTRQVAAGVQKEIPLPAALPVCAFDSLGSASEALKFYTARQSATPSQPLPLPEAVALLVRVKALRPSSYDGRLLALVQRVLAEKENLSLSAVVDVSQALETLNLHGDLPSITSLAVESASFLPGDVIMSLARTLSISSRRAPRSFDAASHTAVFRILGEHIAEDMFEVAPEILGDALLAIASFYCGPHKAAVDLTLSKPWLEQIFEPCADLLVGRAASLPAPALVKCLRAYKLILLSGPRISSSTEMSNRDDAMHILPSVLSEALNSRLTDLSARGTVRSLHSIAALSKHGFSLGEHGGIFCTTAVKHIGQHAKDMTISDISFTMQSLSMLLSHPSGSLVLASDVSELLQILYAELMHHIPSFTLRDALIISRSLDNLSSIEHPGILLELLAAEFVRELRNLKPKHICDVAVAFNSLRFDNLHLFEGLAIALIQQLPNFQPRQLTLTLHGLVKAGVHDENTFLQVGKHIVASLMSFQPRDMALSLWAFTKATHRNVQLFSAVQDDLKRQESLELAPADVSMILWSFSKAEVEVDADLLGILAHYVSRQSRSFPVQALLVTCLGFARLGFAQQPVLVDLYRSLYGQLPRLTDAQLAFSFFLFSTSGLRDDALVQRFLYECRCRLPGLHGQELSNILLACSRTVTPTSLVQPHALRDPFRARVFDMIDQDKLSRASLLGVYLAAPSLLELTNEDSISLMDALVVQFEDMDASELVRCLLATVKLDFVHKPFLLPLFHFLRKRRGHIDSAEAVSCVYAVNALGFCKPKFRRSLAVVLLAHVRRRSIAPRVLRDVLPALANLGMWERLPPSLRRSIWKMASNDMKRGISAPPPAREPKPEDVDPKSASQTKWSKENTLRLIPLQPGLLRKRSSWKGKDKTPRGSERGGYAVVQKPSGWDVLEYMKAPPGKNEKIVERERELLDKERPDLGKKSAVQDFVEMIRKL